jgi:two-component system NtrC family response regulator
MANILIIDDDQDFSRAFQRIIERMGHPCRIAQNIRDAFAQLKSMNCDLIFLDVNLPDGNGLAHIKQFQSFPSLPEVVILTGDGDSDGATLAIANGAWDYVGKPISLNNITLILQRTIAYRASKEQIRGPRKVKRSLIIGESPVIMGCLEVMGKAAVSRSNVIITGETGTGKELFARGIHENSDTPGKLVVIDCTNLSTHLAESTLFGHTKGSFTSAHEARDGLFKLANNGTVFLDEIGELSLDLQKSLLRVLQERKFRPIGSEKEVSSNFRVIAATNRDLRLMVEQGLFRNDLYYRLNGHQIEIPPLRARKEDILLLAEYYTEKFCRESSITPKTLTPEFLNALHAYNWPGNVREFVNTIAVAIDNCQDEPSLYSHHLPVDVRIGIAKNSFRHHPDKEQPTLLEPGRHHGAIPLPFSPGEDLPPLREVREIVVGQLENAYMRQLLELCGNDVPTACERSGLSRARLYELLKKHSIRLK